MSSETRLAELAELAAFGTATIGEVAPAARILDGAIRPIRQGAAAAGTAFTVACRPGDNLAVHLAIRELAPGDMLVVDYGGSLETGPFGEILALACMSRQAAGLVIDGAVRDTQPIRDLGFPVFSRGVCIRGTTKADRGALRVPVRLGGVEVRHGDIVVADDDAVVVVDAADLAAALDGARRRAAREAEIMARVRGGETTVDILGLKLD